MSNQFSFLFMTNVVDVALEAESAGVDWIFLDLERRGKRERQGGRSTIISEHSLEDVRRVRQAMSSASVLLRLNPMHSETPREIEDGLDAGAQALMLPMVTTPEEVEQFVDMVAGRAVVWPLLETVPAIVRAAEIVAVRGVTRVHVGLNDLHLSAHLNFMHESLAGGLVEQVAICARRAEPAPIFGFGGSARVSEPHPVPPSDVLLEHARIGSRAIIVSRTFHGDPRSLDHLRSRMDLRQELDALRAVLTKALARTPDEVERDRLRIQRAIFDVARRLRKRE